MHVDAPDHATSPALRLVAPPPRTTDEPARLRLRLTVRWSGNEFEPPEVARTGGPLFGSHFENVPRVGRWAALGVCRDATAAFFPERGQRFDTAIALCRSCPVVEPCRAYGLAHSSLKGIFGGLTEDERRRIRSASRQARPTSIGDVDRILFDHLHAVLRYPVRTWASVAWARERGPVDEVGRRCASGDYPVPPGRWELVVSPRAAGWELWVRLLERDLPSARHRAGARRPSVTLLR